MQIRIAGIESDSIVDGPGLRLTVFTQGCGHNCPGCHNPETHPPGGGYLIDLDDVVLRFKDNPTLDGLTLSGGEPFLQPAPCAELARRVKALNLSVVTYTGFIFEKLLKSENPDVLALIKNTDILIDGPYKEKSRDLTLPFRGSANQRLIDAQKSLTAGATVEYKE